MEADLLQAARDTGMTILSAEDVHEMGPTKIAETIVDVVGDRPTYLTFDVDALDPAFAPGTGTPEMGGLHSWQVRAILRVSCRSTSSAWTSLRSRRPSTMPRSPRSQPPRSFGTIFPSRPPSDWRCLVNRNMSWFNVTSLTLGFAFLYLPILILVIYSFNESRLVTVWGASPPAGMASCFRTKG
jgi:hypothetical protein